MASPFSIFRKNQKVMLAVITLLAMGAFVFIPIIMQMMGGHENQNPVVAKTTAFGDVRAYDLSVFRQNHLKVLEVLGELSARGEIATAVASGELTPEAAKAIEPRYAALYRQQYERRFGPASEDNLVNIWLLARHGERLGMVIGDPSIRNVIKDITRNSMTTEEIQALMNRAGISATQFFDQMREEMLAQQVQQSFQASLFVFTPGQRWDYFNRVKREATIEAIPVDVSNFVSQIKDPSEEELEKYFEKHKNQQALPDSPTPGFFRPHAIALEYFKADYEAFAAANPVTDKEIQSQYEKNKDRYDQTFGISSPMPSAPTEKLPAEMAPADVSKGKAETKQAEPKNEQPKAEPPKTETKKPVEDKDAKKTSYDDRRPRMVLASLIAEEDADEPSLKAPVPDAPTKTEPAAKTPATPAATTEKPAEKAAAAAKPAEAKAAEAGKATLPNLPALPKKGLTDAMKKVIRRDILQQRILKVFEGVREPLDQYAEKRSGYEVEKINSQSPLGPPPPGPSFKDLAKNTKLTVNETGLLPDWDMRVTEIGMSFINGRTYVSQYAYQSLATYRPTVSVGESALYLFWKTEDAKAHVPKFTDKGVREEVLRWWKIDHARKLALEQAKTMADEAKKAKTPLKQLMANRPNWRVVLPTKFSWMTLPSVAGPQRAAARLTTVAGVPMAGEEFMRTVFGLEAPGQIAVTMNAPQTIAYVVRLVSFSPSYDVRKPQFEVDDFSTYASVGIDDQRRTIDAWMREVKRSAGFEWGPAHRAEGTADADQPASQSRPIETDSSDDF